MYLYSKNIYVGIDWLIESMWVFKNDCECKHMWAGCACDVQAHKQIGNTELDHFLQSNTLQGKNLFIFA